MENFWDLPHSRTAPTSGSTADVRDWHEYQRYRTGGMISLTKRLSPLAGARGMSWSDDGIEILAPTGVDALLDGLLGRINDMSYVLRVWHVGRSILVPGDIEEPGWRRLLQRGVDLRADVLVASHHGRRSGYFEPAVHAISPTFVVVSTGPLAAAEDAHRLYRARVRAGNFYSTRTHGTICIRFHDTGWLEIVPERRPPTRLSPSAPSLAALLAQRPPMPPAAAALARLLAQRPRRPLR